jgi:hypothetical protein
MVVVWWATIHPEEAGPKAQTIGVLGIDIAQLTFTALGWMTASTWCSGSTSLGVHC